MNLLFIHGAGFTGDVFALQRQVFRDAHAPNLPGHQAPGSASSIEEFGEFVVRYIEEQRLDNVVLCGHSMGGAIALEVALSGAVPVEGILLIGASARMAVSQAFLAGLATEFDRTARTICEALFASPTEADVQRALRSMRRVGPEQTLRDFEACDAFDVRERLGELRVPLLAVTGEADTMTPPKYAQALVDRVPGAESRIIPGAGHLPMAERPEETNGTIAAFLSKTSELSR